NPVDDDYLWQVCTKLCKLKHSSVIQILWAARFDCHVLICSQFEAGYFTLQDSLRACTPSGFDSGITQILMLQLSSAAKHLNNLGILYLNWTSGNILSYQSDQGIVVKLSNFSAAACIDYYDVGFLQLVLPTNILMPEVYKNMFLYVYLLCIYVLVVCCELICSCVSKCLGVQVSLCESTVLS
ncbi:hypothetical protein BgiMline_015459, partial [Biomphalaria glabrata]